MKAQIKKLIVALLIFGLIAAGCAPKTTLTPEETAAQPVETVAPTTPPKEVTIEVLMMPLTDDYAKTLEPYIKDFEQKNPGIKVELTVIPWKDSLQAQIIAFKGGAATDVIYTSPNRIIALEDAGAIAPLEGYADQAYKAKLKPGLLEAGYWKGHLYGVPFTSYGRALYYNIDVFKKAGVDKPPTNWEEFRDVAKKVTGNGVYAFALDGADNWLSEYRVWLYQAGGRWLNDEGTKCVVNSPEGVEAFSFLVDLAVKDQVMYPGSGAAEIDTFQLFAAGTTAMWEQSNYITKLKETTTINYGTANLPQYGKGHPAIGLAESEWLSVSSDSEYKDQAWKFLEYFSTDPYVQLHHNQDITFFPTIPIPDFPMDDPRLGPFIFDTSLPYAPVVMHPKAREITDLIRGELNKAFLGEIGVKEALDNACTAVDQLLGQ